MPDQSRRVDGRRTNLRLFAAKLDKNGASE
jgi:hypothetical protein